MLVRVFKERFLRFLFEDVNLDVFLNKRLDRSKLHLKERLVTSNAFRRFYYNEIGSLEFCINSKPYVEGSKIFGKIDVCKQIDDGAIFVRGWIFNPRYVVQSLTISINECRYSILAFHLNRLDVFEQLGFIPNSRNCGFVGILEACRVSAEEVSIGFEVNVNEELVTGTFESVRVS